MGVPNRPGRLGGSLAMLLVVVVSLSAFTPASNVSAAAQPDAWVYTDPTAPVFIGEQKWFSVGFANNSATATGYGPYIDLFLPAAGADGAGPAIDDGLTFDHASLNQIGLMTPLTPTPLICAGGTFTHPLTRLATHCVDGEQVLIFELPFGSFAPNQPTQYLHVYALLSGWADPGTSLRLRAGGGFWLGNDPLDNPASDPPILADEDTLTITPTVPLTLAKLSRNPEPPDTVNPGPRFGETATGFSFPQHFFLTLDIPAGQTITNLRLSDLLPATMVYSEVNSITPSTCTIVREPPRSGPQPPPNNELAIGCPSITGGGGDNDVTLTFTYWVPRLDADGAPVLDPITGALRVLGNDAAVSGDWQPLDPRDSLFPITISPDGPEDQVRAQSIAVQKETPTLAVDPQRNWLSPGDTLEYTLNFQISDYFSFDTIVISDTLSDGQRYLPGSARLTLADRGGAVSGAFTDGVSLNVDTSQIGNSGPGVPRDGTDGSTVIAFDVSRAMRDLGDPDGVVQGAQALLPRGSAAYGSVTFRAVIQERFSDSYPSGDPSVDMWDRFSNVATISGRLLDNQSLAPTGALAADTPDEGDNRVIFELPGPSFTKTVYAINGAACAPPCADPLIEPADTVTFRLTYRMPFVDVENPEFRDFLPLPVFDATEVVTTSPILDSGLPPPGRVAYGPDDSFHTLPGAPHPVLGIDSINNLVSFIYDDYDLDSSPAGVIDLLFTVTASDQPFDNRLYITNQASASEGSTNGGSGRRERISMVDVFLEPLVLRLRKGVVAATSLGGRFHPAVVGPVAFTPPGDPACPRFAGTISSNGLAARPINSNLRNLLPGEHFTFAIVIENYGPSSDGAFDVTLRDELPPGLVRTGDPICVTDGTGAPLAFHELAGGLFGAGIVLDDPGATPAPAGALDPYSPEGGRNVAILTYDVAVEDTVVPPRTLTNTVTLFRYTKTEGGDDDGRDKSDPADVTVVDPTAITLLRFSAAREGDQVVVRWTTGVELNTRGFVLLRSDDGTRAGAVPVTPQPILAQGIDGGGADYAWPDTAAPPGRPYAYWLVELGDATAEYGPVRVGSTLQDRFRQALPMIKR
ncbi:MAG: hypothetical protein HGA45_04415 [Chloroflexales bacterium]|nr:hypothetical protein [Chloroflexales bacterium]